MKRSERLIRRGSGGVALGRTERAARRYFWGAALVVALAAVAVWWVPHVLEPTAREAGALSWRPTAIGACVIVALLLWEVRGALTVLVAGIVLLEVPTLVVRGVSLTALANLGQTLLVGLVLGFVGAVVLRLSRSADVAAQGRRAAARQAAAAHGEQSARSQAAALVHDEVLSVLGLAASLVGVDRGRLASQAGRALEALSGITETASPTEPIEVVLGGVVRGVDPAARVEVRGAGDNLARSPNGAGAARPSVPSPSAVSMAASAPAEPAAPAELGMPVPTVHVPLPVVRAFGSALRQALENSVRHAGETASRTVEVVHDGRSLRVTVIDDGRGFDPRRVAPDRLGLRVSVVRAMRDIGGDALVRSAPGVGTRIELWWPTVPTGRARPHRGTEVGWGGEADPPLVRYGAGALVAAFAASQVLLAMLAMPTARWWWAPPVVLGVLLLAVGVLLGPFVERLTTWRAATVVGLVGLAVLIGVAGAPFGVGELWFASAGAFVLAALAFRQRPLIAALGGVLISLMLVAAGLVHEAPALLVSAVTVRPLGVTTLSVGLAATVFALLRRTAAADEAAVAESAQTAWEQSARAELELRGREVLELVGGTLQVIAGDEPLTDEVRERARVLEGLLRDRIRAGRLAAEPLLGAAMRARLRGVDVVLLDDLTGDLPPQIDLDAVLAAAAAALEQARYRATVRLLPPGRQAVCSLVIDGTPIRTPDDEHPETTTFGG